MTTNKEWFAVDKKGLGQLLERRGKSFALLELISNAWDQRSTEVTVTLISTGTRAKYELVVEDDDPDGFADLTHAFTLFAPSNKKGEAEKRGRFNLGEKLVLAICDTASILSTTGGVRFDAKGRHSVAERRAKGSEFRAILHLTKADYEEACQVITTLIPPVKTTFNGTEIAFRDPLHEFKATIATEISDEEGNLKPSQRKSVVRLFEPRPGETAMIYEMGIPVVENSDRWHYDIGQKVPLNMDRDNVKPAYLRHLRTLVLNEMHEKISTEDANSVWVKEALGDARIDEDAVRSVVTARFGEKVVAFDPSDQEANNKAVSMGYTVVHGRSLSRDEWENVRKAAAILPAGRVTPSESRLFQEQLAANEAGGESAEVPENKWTPGQQVLAAYAKELGRHLIGYEPKVGIVADPALNALAFFGSGKVTFNAGTLGQAWFNNPVQERVDALLIHEFAHDKASNHLDHSFHDECCRLGARMRTFSETIARPKES